MTTAIIKEPVLKMGKWVSADTPDWAIPLLPNPYTWPHGYHCRVMRPEPSQLRPPEGVPKQYYETIEFEMIRVRQDTLPRIDALGWRLK